MAAVAARAFFEGLPARAVTANLEGLNHSYRFEIAGEGSWEVRIRDGQIDVSEGAGNGSADATIRASGEVFDRIVSGAQNAATAYMSGKVRVEGDLGAVLKLQRLFG